MRTRSRRRLRRISEPGCPPPAARSARRARRPDHRSRARRSRRRLAGRAHRGREGEDQLPRGFRGRRRHRPARVHRDARLDRHPRALGLPLRPDGPHRHGLGATVRGGPGHRGRRLGDSHGAASPRCRPWATQRSCRCETPSATVASPVPACSPPSRGSRATRPRPPTSSGALVRQRKEQGADLVKIFASSSQRVGAKPTLTEAQLEVLCNEARALGLRSMVHAYRSQVSAAARAGCGQVEHATYATREDLETAARAGTFISPQVGLVVPELPREQGALSRGGQLHRGRDGHHGARPSPGLRGLPHGRGHPRGEGGVLHRRHRGRPRTQRGGVPRPGGALRPDADGRARLGAAPSPPRRSAWRIASARWLRATRPTSSPSTAIPSADLSAVRRVVFVMRGGVVYKWAGVPN